MNLLKGIRWERVLERMFPQFWKSIRLPLVFTVKFANDWGLCGLLKGGYRILERIQGN